MVRLGDPMLMMCPKSASHELGVGTRVSASYIHAIAVAAGACGGAAQHGGVTATNVHARAEWR